MEQTRNLIIDLVDSKIMLLHEIKMSFLNLSAFGEYLTFFVKLSNALVSFQISPIHSEPICVSYTR